MRLALKLAGEGLGNTSPNPMVGALIVDSSGATFGSGHHAKAGAEHAEVLALRQAGEKARGATLYVTLEPCTHHGQTPPCTDAIKAAGIARVVSAIEDPDQRVRGKGHENLRASGIEVQVGVRAEEAEHLNRMYFTQRSSGRPFVTLKMAQSLDGAIAPRAGESRQLTGKRAAGFVRKLRYEHDAVMVGAGTVLIDDPLLTVRPFKPREVPYTRIIVDARGRIPLRAKVTKDQLRAKTIVATTDLMPDVTRQALAKRGLSVVDCARDDRDFVDLADLLRKLGERNILSVLCEGGPTLAASLIRGGHVNEFQWLVAPLLLGGDAAVLVLGNSPRDVALRLQGIKRLGEDLLVSAQPAR
jgi:diaminohydroxyphosphoribosylaminopyrimidine deaminase/5-amino-6-(5-phosphoribosylamino)uracil reductase